MIRTANFADIHGILGLLEYAYGLSVYAGEKVQIDQKEAKRLLLQSISRHGGTNGGATFVQVAEGNGQINGLIVGVLNRVYAIGNRLSATDLFWIAGPTVEPHEPMKLMRNMIDWAWKSPHVVEVKCGVTAVIQDPDGAGKILERIGMKQFGNLYRMERAL